MSSSRIDGGQTRRGFLQRSALALGTAAAAHLAEAEARSAGTSSQPGKDGQPMIIDAHGHISQVEIQDLEGEYRKNWKYGMGHRDNLYLMDTIGIEMQVLQCAFYLHRYHRRVMKEHPGRFVAISKIDERLLPGDRGLKLIQQHIEEWGFKGWYYDCWPPEQRVEMGMDPKEWGTPDPFHHFDHPRYDPQWELVQSLGVPACVTSYSYNFETLGPGLLNVLKRFPDLKVVVIHGYWPPSCVQDDGSVRIPDAVVELVKNYNVVMEILPGLQHRPDLYGPGDAVLKAFYDTFGPAKLMWGSEYTHVNLPTVDQYRHQFDYVKERCPYMSESDIAQIRGGTAMETYEIRT